MSTNLLILPVPGWRAVKNHNGRYWRSWLMDCTDSIEFARGQGWMPHTPILSHLCMHIEVHSNLLTGYAYYADTIEYMLEKRNVLADKRLIIKATHRHVVRVDNPLIILRFTKLSHDTNPQKEGAKYHEFIRLRQDAWAIRGRRQRTQERVGSGDQAAEGATDEGRSGDDGRHE